VASAFYIDEACSERLSEDRASSRRHETDVLCMLYLCYSKTATVGVLFRRLFDAEIKIFKRSFCEKLCFLILLFFK